MPSRIHLAMNHDCLESLRPAPRRWFEESFDAPTRAQELAWPVIARGSSALLLAPTGSGKTLAAFLVAIDRRMFGSVREADAERAPGVRVLYVSPLKALGVDVERNFRSPIAGVRAVAERDGIPYREPTVGVRSGDTPSAERSRLTRHPPDILITTPESLYLLLTSRARETLRSVDTVIVDEIHTLAGTKRGAHLFLSLERLEALRRESDGHGSPLQRIGLSATQRPLDEIARLLGGGEAGESDDAPPRPRPVEILKAARSKPLELTVEIPVEDLARLGETVPETSGSAAGPTLPSIWPSIYPRLVELVRAHRSTMIFVNSRRLAERLSNAINDGAGEAIARAHHGSVARDTRLEIEDALKRGTLPAIVATSSLELGIDMGAVDLVVQVEAPPSIASGIQRVGRAGHRVGEASRGVLFPKYRGDLLACSAATGHMHRGEVEETRYPRNPLDVLAQQIVAIVSGGPISVDALYQIVRGAAPFFELPRNTFEGVLDLLSGRYPSDEFAGLRPRIRWDRATGELAARRGAQRVAILNGGTIPDRGLYGVFLAEGEGDASRRIGELDEEMVFETRTGDVFLLGASSWRVVDVTHDRVHVLPAPGEPGRMPFWRGEGPGRPLEFGSAIGALARTLVRESREDAHRRLTERHGLDPKAARNLIDYLHQQRETSGLVPTDRTLVVECFLDEIGDWRVAVLSPFGARVHAPWATAAAARLREEIAGEVDLSWTDDGIAFRLPGSDEPPRTDLLVPRSDEVEEIVLREVGSTALFAARFRENAARALLLPRRGANRRTPLWQQRRRAADLLSVASRYRDFPILLETYRECLRDVFDLPGLRSLLRDIEKRAVRVRAVVTKSPSPFAASLLFSYTANFLYDGDTPLSERRAQALALDPAQLREILGDAELRELLVPEVIDEVALELQLLEARRRVRDADGIHDLLLRLGDLSREEIAARVDPETSPREIDHFLAELASQHRALELRIASEPRWVAAEDAARFRDALGAALPPGVPPAFLEPVADPLGDLVSRHARTHPPFRPEQIATRLGIGTAPVLGALRGLAARSRVVEGEFTPGRPGREWCDAEVLRRLRRRSLARLRRHIEPVEPSRLGRFLVRWQGLHRPRRGLDGLLDAIEQLQGAALPFTDLEQEILPARVEGLRPSDLDELCAAGEIVWRGVEGLPAGDGRVALYLADRYAALAPPAAEIDDVLAARVRDLLEERGALFFDAVLEAIGGFRDDLVHALWELVWAGIATNDTLAPLRSLRTAARPERRRALPRERFRSRRAKRPPGTEGRWSLLRSASSATPTERLAALAERLVDRHGILTREMVTAEGIAGGFASLYPVLRAMEEAGRVRRGYFVAGLGAAQFCAPGAEDRLRDPAAEDEPQTRVLAATDPANPWGAALRWPEASLPDARPMRAAGARLVLHDGRLLGYLGRTGRRLLTFVPPDEEPPAARRLLARALAERGSSSSPVFLTQVDGVAPGDSELAPDLRDEGFTANARGYLHRGTRRARA